MLNTSYIINYTKNKDKKTWISSKSILNRLKLNFNILKGIDPFIEYNSSKLF